VLQNRVKIADEYGIVSNMSLTERQNHILIVDDDREIRELLQTYLQKHGYRVSVAEDGRAMWKQLEQARINLVVLDLMLPGEDGLSLCRKLRSESDIAIIMLTAMGEETDRIIGLEMGADDYLAKPFNPRELLARIKGVLRRVRPGYMAEPDDTNTAMLKFGAWKLDTTARHLIDQQGQAVSLSSGEYRLLRIFLDKPNRTLSRDYLLDLISGKDALPYDRSIDVQVGRLRKRLGDDARVPEIIKTVRGAGYVFTSTVEKLG